MSIFEQVAGEKLGTMAGTPELGGFLGSAAGTIGMGMLKSRLPVGLGPAVSAVSNVAGNLYNGDLTGAAMGVVNSGLFTAKLPWLDNAASAAGFMMQPSRAMGGVTPVVAKRMMQASLQTHFAHKNLFLVSVVNAPKDLDAMSLDVDGVGFGLLNLFVVDVNYGPITITADAKKVGSAVLDLPNGTEAIELRLTTMDDEKGRIRRWFSQLSSKVVSSDGTFGVPAQYLVKIAILHSFINEDAERAMLGCKRDDQSWRQAAWFRPVSLESELSRKDPGLEEFTLVFHQYDTYY